MSYDSDYERLITFVTDLQKSVAADAKLEKVGPAIKRARDQAFESGKIADGKLSVRSKDGDEGVLRVLDPTQSVASVKLDRDLAPRSVDFFLTRPAGEERVETRFLGTTKYPDSRGEWSLRFDTERFARTPMDSLVVHAEVTDFRGNLVAVIQDTVGA